MADQYVVAGGGNWSAVATWESSPGAADATGPPAAADVCQNVLNAALVIDANTNAVASYTQTGTGSCAVNATLTATGAVSLTGTCTGTGAIDCGGTFSLSANTNMSGYNGDISSAGDISMGGGTTTFGSSATLTADAAAGARTLTCNAIKLPAFTVNNNLVTSFTASDKTICQSFLMTNNSGNKFTCHATGVDSYGSFVKQAGALAGAGTLTLKVGAGNAGDLKFYPSTGLLRLSVEAGFTATLIGTAYPYTVANAGTINPTTTEYLYLASAGTNWWLGSTGTTNCDVLIVDSNGVPGADVTLTNHTLTLRASSADKSIAFDNNINLGTGDFKVSGVGAGKDMACVMTATKSLVCRDILLGDPAATTGSGQLTLPKTVTCRNIGSANAANTANALIVPDGARPVLSGTFDGEDDGNAITVTIAGGNQWHGGTYANITPSAAMYCTYNCTDGGGNDPLVIFLQRIGGSSTDTSTTGRRRRRLRV